MRLDLFVKLKYQSSTIILSDGIKYSYLVTAITGATENARPDIARPDKAAPYRKGGHRETWLIVRVEAHYKLMC